MMEALNVLLYVLAGIGGWLVFTLAVSGVVSAMKRGGKKD